MLQALRKRGAAWKQQQQGDGAATATAALQRQQQENDVLKVLNVWSLSFPSLVAPSSAVSTLKLRGRRAQRLE